MAIKIMQMKTDISYCFFTPEFRYLNRFFFPNCVDNFIIFYFKKNTQITCFELKLKAFWTDKGILS
jgi:hypothetical protein